MAAKGKDPFTIAHLLGHSDVRMTMRYVRMVDAVKRAAVEAVRPASGKVGQILAGSHKQPPLPVAVNA